MHGPVLPVLILCLGTAGVAVARLFLIPFARALQARRGDSDQLVTELVIAVPLATFILVLIACLTLIVL
jgi:hypothetical protein